MTHPVTPHAREPVLYAAHRDHRLDAVVRLILAGGCASVAMFAGIAAVWGLARPGGWVVVLWVIVVAAAVATPMWASSTVLINGCPAVGFAFLADLSIAAGIGVLSAPSLMFAGCVLFTLTGSFVTIHVSPTGLVAHLLFVTAVIINTAAALVLRGNVVVPVAVLGAAILLWALIGVPLGVRRVWVGVSAVARSASHDHLTGLLNRAGLDHYFHRLAVDATQHGTTLWVIAIDIDTFKAVNDRYGHHTGDAVIIETAHHLTRHYGRAAAIARCGGEEFTVITHGEPHPTHALIRQTPTRTPGIHGPAVTLSIGAATANHHTPNPLRDAMAAADTAMYAAKRQGGNQVVIPHHRSAPTAQH